MKYLTCEKCGATMKAEDGYLHCPYCGSTALSEEDPEVAIARLKYKSETDISKMENERKAHEAELNKDVQIKQSMYKAKSELYAALPLIIGFIILYLMLLNES